MREVFCISTSKMPAFLRKFNARISLDSTQRGTQILSGDNLILRYHHFDAALFAGYEKYAILNRLKELMDGWMGGWRNG